MRMPNSSSITTTSPRAMSVPFTNTSTGALAAPSLLVANNQEAQIKDLRKRAEQALRDKDTADIFTEVSRGTDKWLWFVEAHLQAER